MGFITTILPKKSMMAALVSTQVIPDGQKNGYDPLPSTVCKESGDLPITAAARSLAILQKLQAKEQHL